MFPWCFPLAPAVAHFLKWADDDDDDDDDDVSARVAFENSCIAGALSCPPLYFFVTVYPCQRVPAQVQAVWMYPVPIAA